MQNLTQTILRDTIFNFCDYDPQLIGIASSVSKEWCKAARNEKLWERICKLTLGDSASLFQGSWKKRFTIYQNWNKGLFQQSQTQLKETSFLPPSLTNGSFHINFISEDSIKIEDWITQKSTTLLYQGAFVKDNFQISNENSKYMVVKTALKDLAIFDKKTGQLLYSLSLEGFCDTTKGALTCNEQYIASYEEDLPQIPKLRVWELEFKDLEETELKGLKLVWDLPFLAVFNRDSKRFYFQNTSLIWDWSLGQMNCLWRMDMTNKIRTGHQEANFYQDTVLDKNTLYRRRTQAKEFSVINLSTKMEKVHSLASSLDIIGQRLIHALSYLSGNFYVICDGIPNSTSNHIRVWDVRTEKLAFEKRVEGLKIKKITGDETRLFLTDDRSQIITWNFSPVYEPKKQVPDAVKPLESPKPTQFSEIQTKPAETVVQTRVSNSTKSLFQRIIEAVKTVFHKLATAFKAVVGTIKTRFTLLVTQVRFNTKRNN